MPNQFNYFLNDKPFKNRPFVGFDLIDNDGKPIELPQNKVLVLDFWTTSCGVCFKKFPEFEKLFKEYKNDTKIEFYSINVPTKRDEFTKTRELVNKLGYDFQTVYAKSKNDVESKLKISGYPSFMIVKDNIIQFDGYLNINPVVLVYNSKNELEKIVK
ncbi:hypothetical protein GCM10022271_10990 [Corallibacter vietnamensis]|uniref:Thioredoxin domain-containing protein n=1 Tax=Corallibacter vietnamensis TaxID=904130 RepID=A0ABP7H0M5_9FLAO